MFENKFLRFEDKVYVRQWMQFRKPKLSDMEESEDGTVSIDCGIGRLALCKDITLGKSRKSNFKKGDLVRLIDHPGKVWTVEHVTAAGMLYLSCGKWYHPKAVMLDSDESLRLKEQSAVPMICVQVSISCIAPTVGSGDAIDSQDIFLDFSSKEDAYAFIGKLKEIANHE